MTDAFGTRGPILQACVQGTGRGSPDGGEDLFWHVRRLWRLAWRARVMIAVSAVVGALLAGLWAGAVQPLYTASTEIVLEPETAVRVLPGVPDEAEIDPEAFASKVAVLHSRDLLATLAADLTLERDPEFNSLLREPASLTQAAWAVSSALRELIGAGPVQGLSSPSQSVHTTLAQRIAVEPVGRSKVVRVSVSSHDPDKAARIANRLVALYAEAEVAAKRKASENAARWLSKQVNELQEQVATADRELQTYRARAGLVRTLGDDTAARRIDALVRQLVQAQAREAMALDQATQLENLAATPSGAAEHPSVVASEAMARLRDQEQSLKRQAADMATRLGERHPDRQGILRQLEANRASQAAEITRIAASARLAAASASRWRVQAEEALRAAQEIAYDPQAAVEINALERRTSAMRTLYENFLTRSKEVVAGMSLGQLPARVISTAEPPSVPSFPRTRLLTAGGGALGAALAFMVAFLRDRTCTSIRSASDVAEVATVTPMAIMPAISGRARRAGTDVIERDPVYAEGLRRLALTLMLRVDGPVSGRVVAVASSLSGEAKTSTAVDLAIIMAALGRRAVVVDADLRKPDLHRIVRLANSHSGLSECLCRGIDPVDAVVTASCGIDVLLSGSMTSEAAGVLVASSERLADVYTALRRCYDLVIVDTAPVAAASETLNVLRLADETVFLVRWNRTDRELVRSSIDRVQDFGGRVSGVVVTRANVRDLPHYERGDAAAYHRALKRYYKV
ncbi:Uncharacterized protein involved in exopolysaccharide biosynthesis [Azospirillum oryzae]|uniref:non-specific protein-tyrosine kinase n=2 Tax=Bacteria TaxID=2 RepID=A0A1X7F101_9PROT|nr:polysaccharide biosynthesis tyrosine autokinase [Azospirillum oryzae]SMF44004.1 Uncharacterized protein involved in exopolysaccharide biosynthesis [Azospirillum oryzae]